jgi:hypothetical protein
VTSEAAKVALPPASSQFYEPLPPCSSSAAIAGRLLPSLEPQCAKALTTGSESTSVVEPSALLCRDPFL